MSVQKPRRKDRPLVRLSSRVALPGLTTGQIEAFQEKIAVIRETPQKHRRGVSMSLRPDHQPVQVLNLDGEPRCLS